MLDLIMIYIQVNLSLLVLSTLNIETTFQSSPGAGFIGLGCHPELEMLRLELGIHCEKCTE